MTETEWNALTVSMTVMLWAVAIGIWLPPVARWGRFGLVFDRVFTAITTTITAPVQWAMRLLRFDV